MSFSTTSNNLPYEMKRNLESLARAGYIKTLPDDDDGDASYKRSIASLAKNGMLPLKMTEKEKRGIESLARNGELYPRRNLRELLEDLYVKRSIASLARDYNFPVYGKKSLSSLAKSGDLSYARMQRNTDAVKQDSQSYEDNIHKQTSTEDKRNLQSIKAQSKPKFKRSIDGKSNSRNKREADYFYPNEELPLPLYQNQNVYDYDDVLQEINEPDVEKRFLGRLPQMGTSKPTPKTRRYL